MTRVVGLFLGGTILALASVIVPWLLISHATVDWLAFATSGVLAAIPVVAGLIYTFVRPDGRLAVTLFALGFLIAFGPICTALNYALIPMAGSRIDGLLVKMDLLIGFDWQTAFFALAKYPLLVWLLGVAYAISAFQVAVPVIVLGYNGEPKEIFGLCIATVICALSTIAFWTWHPSMGPTSLYDMAELGKRAGINFDVDYSRFLAGVLDNGIPPLNPTNSQGLVAFPSFHTQELIITLWYVRKQGLVFYGLAAFSLLAFLSIPVQGGHHLVDMIGGAIWAAIGIALSQMLTRRLTMGLAVAQ